jgi:hypothetical protein
MDHSKDRQTHRDPTPEELAQAAALLKAAQEAAEKTASEKVNLIMEQLREDVIKDARKAGEESAKKAAESMTGASERATKIEKGAKLAYYIGGAAFFISSGIMAGLTAYRSRKASAAGTTQTETPAAAGRTR